MNDDIITGITAILTLILYASCVIFLGYTTATIISAILFIISTVKHRKQLDRLNDIGSQNKAATSFLASSVLVILFVLYSLSPLAMITFITNDLTETK